LGIRRRFGGTPVWAVAAVAALMVVAMFATLSTLLARQGSVVQQEILALHRGLPAISIERTEPVTQPYVAPVSQQLDRIRAALTGEIDQGLVVVDQTNQFIFVRVGDALRFASGSADLENDFSELAAAIARSVDPEAGPIRVVGYTDSIPPSGRGRFKTNEDLSLARADTVGGIMGPLLADPTRVATEGLGPVDPIADNETTEGRALNRRVEIMIAREGTF
jgi:type VI secretion system protein ImpK